MEGVVSSSGVDAFMACHGSGACRTHSLRWQEKLSGMDDLMAQIEDIETQIEKFRPKTQEEKIELRHNQGKNQ